jgi:hypothetical protein
MEIKHMLESESKQYKDLLEEVNTILSSYYIALKLSDEDIYYKIFKNCPYDAWDPDSPICDAICVSKCRDGAMYFSFSSNKGILVSINPKDLELVIEIRGSKNDNQYKYLKQFYKENVSKDTFRSLHFFVSSNGGYEFNSYGFNKNTCIELIKNFISSVGQE